MTFPAAKFAADGCMRYVDFRDSIQSELRRNSVGLTWAQLQERLALPYERPCPEWTMRLEQEIGLCRVKGKGRALVWKMGKARRIAKPQAAIF